MHRIGIILLFVFFCIGTSYAHAAYDTDGDGLSDAGENEIFMTNPEAFDTDQDHVSDGMEVMDHTNPNDQQDSLLSESTHEINDRFFYTEHIGWYIARASGITAFIVFTLVVCNGLMISSRAFYRIAPPLIILDLHKTLSILGFSLVLVHAGALLFDQYIDFSLLHILIPFTFRTDYLSATGYPLGIAISIGVISLYLIIILILTSIYRTRIPTFLWRITHYSSFSAYILFLAHGWMAGTDTNTPWMHTIYIASGILVLILLCVRVYNRTLLPLIRTRWSQ